MSPSRWILSDFKVISDVFILKLVLYLYWKSDLQGPHVGSGAWAYMGWKNIFDMLPGQEKATKPSVPGALLNTSVHL